MSALIGHNPQAFLDLLYPRTRFIKHHRTKLANTQRQPDAVIEAQHLATGKRFLAQPEIQTYGDSTIAERLVLYQVLLRWQYKLALPVSSSVLHLTKAHEDTQVPLRWTAPGEDDEREEKAVDFFYKSVEMRDKTPEDILRLDHAELLPLLPATQGGANQEIIELMMLRLQSSYNVELAYYGYLIASLIFSYFRQPNDLEWLQRRYKTMDDKFSVSPAYQWTLDEGRAQGEAQTLAQIRQPVIQAIFEKFPSLTSLTKEVVAMMNDPALLFALAIKLVQAQSNEEARQLLLNAQLAS